MPNHVRNIVTINGSAEHIKEFKLKHINAYKYIEEDSSVEICPFSFQTIIPRPESLDIESSTRAMDGLDYVLGDEAKKKQIRSRFWRMDDEEFNKIVELGKTAKRNLELYDAKDWYDWDIDNWGTKWDCYDVELKTLDDTEVVIVFNTAWSCPEPVYGELARLHPDLSIQVEYADEDLGNNCGVKIYEGGCQTDEWYCDRDFACELWGYRPEEGETEKEEDDEEL